MKRFHTVSDEVIQQAMDENENINTKKSHKLWGNMFLQYLNEVKEEKSLNLLDEREISKHLQRFFYQLRKANGEEYKGGSIRTGLSSTIAFIHEETGINIDIDKDKELYKVIDLKLKGLAKKGKDETDHATPLTEEQEKRMVNSFNVHTPMGLLSYVYYHIAKFCAARGGYPWTIEFKELLQCKTEDGKEYFKVFIPMEKNNQRGLRAGMARECVIPPDSSCIRWIRKYLLKRPENACEFLFLGIESEKNVQKGLWYKSTRIDKKILNSIIKNAANTLEFPPGKYVPHSIRATAASILFDGGIDNKSAMAITGHRSEAGLRQYQTVTEIRKENLALVLNRKEESTGRRVLGMKRSFSTITTKTTETVQGEKSVFKGCRVKVNMNPDKVPKDLVFENCDVSLDLN